MGREQDQSFFPVKHTGETGRGRNFFYYSHSIEDAASAPDVWEDVCKLRPDGTQHVRGVLRADHQLFWSNEISRHNPLVSEVFPPGGKEPLAFLDIERSMGQTTVTVLLMNQTDSPVLDKLAGYMDRNLTMESDTVNLELLDPRIIYIGPLGEYPPERT